MIKDYYKLIKMLMDLDEQQVLELCHDMADEEDGIAAIERIGACMSHYMDNYEPPNHGSQSEYDEWTQIDDARRYRDHQQGGF